MRQTHSEEDEILVDNPFRPRASNGGTYRGSYQPVSGAAVTATSNPRSICGFSLRTFLTLSFVLFILFGVMFFSSPPSTASGDLSSKLRQGNDEKDDDSAVAKWDVDDSDSVTDEEVSKMKADFSVQDDDDDDAVPSSSPTRPKQSTKFTPKPSHGKVVTRSPVGSDDLDNSDTQQTGAPKIDLTLAPTLPMESETDPDQPPWPPSINETKAIAEKGKKNKQNAGANNKKRAKKTQQAGNKKQQKNQKQSSKDGGGKNKAANPKRRKKITRAPLDPNDPTATRRPVHRRRRTRPPLDPNDPTATYRPTQSRRSANSTRRPTQAPTLIHPPLPNDTLPLIHPPLPNDTLPLIQPPLPNDTLAASLDDVNATAAPTYFKMDHGKDHTWTDEMQREFEEKEANERADTTPVNNEEDPDDFYEDEPEAYDIEDEGEYAGDDSDDYEFDDEDTVDEGVSIDEDGNYAYEEDDEGDDEVYDADGDYR